MKKVLLAFLLVSIFSSCIEEEPIKDLSSFDELNGQVLEIVDVESISNGESEIFNFYATGIRFNSEGTYVLLDDNYGQNSYWVSRGSIYNWSLSGDKLTLESERDGKAVTFMLEVINLDKNGLSLKEINPELQYALQVSNKQNVK